MSDYVKVGELGKGSYSVVNKVVFKGNVKAAKEYKDEIGLNETTIMSLGLPYIMKYDEVVYIDDRWVMIMECMECDLQTRLRREVPMKTKREWVRKLATAVNSLHVNGYSHSDLKPGNILVDPDDNIYLTDFSISSKFYHMNDGLVNTANFKTPEDMNDVELASKYKNRADSWAFGMIVLLIYLNIPNWSYLEYNCHGEISNYKILLSKFKECSNKEDVYELLRSIVSAKVNLEEEDLSILKSVADNNLCMSPKERSWMNVGIVPYDPKWLIDMKYDPPKCLTPRKEIREVAADVMKTLVDRNVTDRYYARSFNIFVYILPLLEKDDPLNRKELKEIMAVCTYIGVMLNHKRVSMSMISAVMNLSINKLQNIFTKVVLLTNGNFNYPDVLGLGVDYTSAVDILVG